MSDVSEEGRSKKWLAGYRQGWYTPEQIEHSAYTSFEVAQQLLKKQEQDFEREFIGLPAEYAVGHREFLAGVLQANYNSVEVYFDLLAKGIQLELERNPELAAHKAEMKKGVHMRNGHYIQIELAAITATDLRLDAAQIEDSDGIEAYRLYLDDQVETADVLWFSHIQRMGIAWGANATWADASSVEEGIRIWLEDPEEWARRN